MNKILSFKKKLHRSSIKRDEKFTEELKNLRSMVETINRTPDIALRGGIYKELAKVDVFTFCMDGVEIGYKVTEHGLWFKRKIFVKFPGYKIEEIPDEQKDAIMMSVFDAMLDKGGEPADIDVIDKGRTVVIEQQFMIWTLVYDKNIPRGKGDA